MDHGTPSGGRGPSGQVPPTEPAPTAPIVNWAPPPMSREIPGAPGLAIADTATRLVAYIVDILILGVATLIVGALLGQAQTRLGSLGATWFSLTTSNALGWVLLTMLDAAYFIVSWTGGRRATVGQRLFHLQVGNEVDGSPLSGGQAVRRWIVLGGVAAVLGLIRPVQGAGSAFEALWLLILLISTAISPTKQGLHDRFANSAVVAPSGVGRSGLATALLLVLGVIAILAFVFVAIGLSGLGGSS
jgi:uncharacterized RDD family membrane protein YckC